MSAPQFDPKRDPKNPIDPESKKRKYPLSDESERGKKKREQDRDSERDEPESGDDEQRMLGGEG